LPGLTRNAPGTAILAAAVALAAQQGQAGEVAVIIHWHPIDYGLASPALHSTHVPAIAELTADGRENTLDWYITWLQRLIPAI
jgi:hypothetical protein